MQQVNSEILHIGIFLILWGSSMLAYFCLKTNGLYVALQTNNVDMVCGPVATIWIFHNDDSFQCKTPGTYGLSIKQTSLDSDFLYFTVIGWNNGQFGVLDLK